MKGRDPCDVRAESRTLGTGGHKAERYREGKRKENNFVRKEFPKET